MGHPAAQRVESPHRTRPGLWYRRGMVARSERRWALAVALAYLVLGFVAWWTSPTADPVSGDGRDTGSSMVALWITTVLLTGFAVMPWRDRITTWLVPAVIGPLALASLALHPDPWPAFAVAFLWPVAILPLGLVVALGPPSRALSLAMTAVAVVVGVAVAVRWWGQTNELSILRYGAVIAILAVSATPRLVRWRSETDITAYRVSDQATVTLAVVAPSLAGLVLMTSWVVGAAVLVTGLAATVAAAWIAVRPLTWLVARDTARREATLVANESERRRLAADIHDGPLQDVLLLARRLDDAGDVEGAALARSVAADLRELSGDLRLPMLDDLGVGPSLEWLAGRVRRATALDVRADVAVAARPPAPVELAAFRIAQEAVANAVRHGSPPIIVRCRSAAASLSMTVTDAGHGAAPTPADRGTGPVRLGLSTMRQRAEAIGAELAWSRATGGGTVVSLEWRSHGA